MFLENLCQKVTIYRSSQGPRKKFKCICSWNTSFLQGKKPHIEQDYMLPVTSTLIWDAKSKGRDTIFF